MLCEDTEALLLKTMTKIIKTYSELITLPTFEERYEYLKLGGVVGEDTFGFDRIFNQKFYRSTEWRTVRNRIIVRDNGCDLGIEDYPIIGTILIHHMNPIGVSDIRDATEFLMDPNYLICVSMETHNAIHYGSFEKIDRSYHERKPNDTCPWRK